MAEQIILRADENYTELNGYLKKYRIKKIFLVCGKSISLMRIGRYFEVLKSHTGIQIIYFNHFISNPSYESVVEGVSLFRKENCDLIIAVGGGSAIDVAKCIKLYSNMDNSKNYLKQMIIPNSIPFIAVPTTAGTGSETTRYAVIYFKGEKQSVSDNSCIPSAVLLDASSLKTLPEYQKKSSMMDALCHAIESFWSVNSTEKSKSYSREAIQAILESKDSYLKNEDAGNAKMLIAANIAGKAINITQTTAGHAMCYKLTSLYDITHGHAVALCVLRLWPYMIEHIEQCIDPRGTQYLNSVFGEIAEAMGCKKIEDAVERYKEIVRDFDLGIPKPKAGDFEILKKSVNMDRLKNNPVRLNCKAIDRLYHQILSVSDMA